jgi:hypothetical protein
MVGDDDLFETLCASRIYKLEDAEEHVDRIVKGRFSVYGVIGILKSEENRTGQLEN